MPALAAVVFQLIACAALLPAVTALVTAFVHDLHALRGLEPFFQRGVWTFLLSYLFFCSFRSVFTAGQKAFSEIFRSVPWAAEFLPLVVPLYTTVLLSAYFLASLFWRVGRYADPVVFAVGFTLAMHVVLAARDLYEEDSRPLKPHYLFMLIWICAGAVIVTAVLMDVVFSSFSFTRFWADAWGIAQRNYHHIWRLVVR